MVSFRKSIKRLPSRSEPLKQTKKGVEDVVRFLFYDFMKYCMVIWMSSMFIEPSVLYL